MRKCSGIEKFWNSLVPASGRSYFYRPAINQDKQENPSNDFKETKQKNKLCSSHFITYSIPHHSSKWMNAFCLLFTHLMNLGLESQSQTNLCALFDSPGVNFSWDGEKGLRPPFMLDESTRFAIIVEAGLHRCQGVQCMLGPNSEGVVVAWEAVGQLRTYCSVCKRAHCMVVRCTQGVPLVIPNNHHRITFSPHDFNYVRFNSSFFPPQKNKQTSFWYIKYSQSQCSNEVCISEAQTRIILGEIPSCSVKREVSSKRESIATNYTREINNGVRSQT